MLSKSFVLRIIKIFYKSAFQVGAVVAVSLVHDRANVSCATFKKIAMAWFVTLPVSGVISALSYHLICLWVLWCEQKHKVFPTWLNQNTSNTTNIMRKLSVTCFVNQLFVRRNLWTFCARPRPEPRLCKLQILLKFRLLFSALKIKQHHNQKLESNNYWRYNCK